MPRHFDDLTPRAEPNVTFIWHLSRRPVHFISSRLHAHTSHHVHLDRNNLCLCAGTSGAGLYFFWFFDCWLVIDSPFGWKQRPGYIYLIRECGELSSNLNRKESLERLLHQRGVVRMLGHTSLAGSSSAASQYVRADFNSSSTVSQANCGKSATN